MKTHIPNSPVAPPLDPRLPAYHHDNMTESTGIVHQPAQANPLMSPNTNPVVASDIVRNPFGQDRSRESYGNVVL